MTGRLSPAENKRRGNGEIYKEENMWYLWISGDNEHIGFRWNHWLGPKEFEGNAMVNRERAIESTRCPHCGNLLYC